MLSTPELGIFTSVFPRPTFGETLAAIQALGLRHVQLNLASAGLPDMPDTVDPAQIAMLKQQLDQYGISVAAVSGTFNMAHPDAAERAHGLQCLEQLARMTVLLGAPGLTLCSGSRNRESMWRAHPENNTDAAWQDMLDSMRQAVALAERAGIWMAVEPEVSNVVDSAARARAMLDAVGSPALKIVIDGANLFHHGELPHMQRILDEAFALLGPEIVFAHAKDLDHDGEAGHLAAGAGLLDYPRYLSLLQRYRIPGPLIMHGLTEAQAPQVCAFLRGLGVDG